jgi:serine-type D-Ala-D-Ala carboxypeptidase/endopeptidase (penicillin-binding protein 4)
MTTKTSLRGTAVLLAFALVTACGARTSPVTRPPAGAVAETAAPLSPRHLAAELDRIFDAPGFGRMQWGVLVQSLDSGAVLYSRNAARLVMPASNMKIVTLAAAAERLGWDFHFHTRLLSAAAPEAGTLKGDLVIVGGGDPTINGRGGSATRVFEGWADGLRAAGIQRIEGGIVADAGAFDSETLGAGWAWDYLGYGYAAGVSALQYNEDVATLAIRPGPRAGAPAGILVRPAESGLLVENRVTTAAAGSEADIELGRLPGSDRLIVSGGIPEGSQELRRTATVSDPALYFARVLRATLRAKGIAVEGEAMHRDGAGAGLAAVLTDHESPPLSEIGRVMMKVSQNLYAETLLRALGAAPVPEGQGVAPTGFGRTGTAAAGHKIVREVLTGWGVQPDAYVLADGSGLSRYNYLCPETLVTVLRAMYREPRHRQAFLDTFPVGGQEGGTLSRRFKGTRAESNVRGKTGSIANVRALSGYVTTSAGEMLAFSIVANAFTQPQETIDAATDHAVERLANLTR